MRSPPPPKVKILKALIDDLLKRGVIRPSKLPYASQAFLVPKGRRYSHGGSLTLDLRQNNFLFLSFAHDSAGISTLCWCSGNFSFGFELLLPLLLVADGLLSFVFHFGLYEFNVTHGD
jgi:hypothetical protein